MFKGHLCSTYARTYIAAMTVAVAVFASGCAGTEEDDGGGSSNVSLTGVASVVGATSSARVGRSAALAVNDYKLFCMTFEAEPQAVTSDIGADGSFSLDLPSETPFGCFINLASTNATACVINVVDSSSTGMNGAASQSSVINLASSVELASAINCDPAVGVATIAKSELAAAVSTKSSKLDLATIHSKAFTMECIATGETDQDAACAEFVGHSPNVFFRIVTGTAHESSGDTEITGLGAWASEAAFAACGSVDVDPDYIGGAENFTPDAGVVEGEWTLGGSCTERTKSDSTGAQVGAGSPQDMYVLEKLSNDGGMWKMVQHEAGSYTSSSLTCEWTHMTAISMGSGSSDYAMIGNFQTVESNTCDTSQNRSASFVIGFKEQ